MKSQSPIAAFKVDESFQIEGRGVALATAGDLSMLLPGRLYPIRFKTPDGTATTAYATVELILRRQPVTRQTFAILAKHCRKEDVPPGTLVTIYPSHEPPVV